LNGLAAIALPAGFGAPFPPTVGPLAGTATDVSCSGGVASGAKSAAKLLELREPEFPWLNQPADEAGVMLVAIAGSMAEVTVKVRADREGSSLWMHLGHQPGEAQRMRHAAKKKQWNQANRNFADGAERRAGVPPLGKPCPRPGRI
jgi:hypothetical protein